MNARDEMLARVRAAIGGAEPIEVPTIRADHEPVGAAGLLARFADRLEDYGAGVRVVGADEVGGAVATALDAGLRRRVDASSRSARRVVVPPGLPPAWLADVTADVDRDDGLDATALDAYDAVVTAAAVAIAETGTIVLDGSSAQGRRALSLVPDVHVCVVDADQIVAGVTDAMPHLDPRRPLTWISGPSATSDIELERVDGVHGPRNLEVVVLTHEG